MLGFPAYRFLNQTRLLSTLPPTSRETYVCGGVVFPVGFGDTPYRVGTAEKELEQGLSIHPFFWVQC